MSKEYRRPGVGEGGRTQLVTHRSSRCRPWFILRAVVLVVLVLQTACATGEPMGGKLPGTSRSWHRGDGAHGTSAVSSDAASKGREVSNLRRAAMLPWDDALQVGGRVLWEIKTDQFEGYSAFLKKRVVEDQLEEFGEERSIAEFCGYAFKVGVSSEAHKAALLGEDDTFDIVVTGCER